jgi:hypothetical protein
MIVYSIRKLWPYIPVKHFSIFVLDFSLLILKTVRVKSHNLFRYVHVISVLVRILMDIFNTYWNLRISTFFYRLLRLSLPFLVVLLAVIIRNATSSGVTNHCCMWVCNAHLFYDFLWLLPCEINKIFNSANCMRNSSSGFLCFAPFIFCVTTS